MLLELAEVSKSYGREQVLTEVKLKVFPGEVCGLIGPDGAGKTTLLQLVAGLQLPTSGTIQRDGSGSLGYVPQQFGLYEEMSIMENLTFFGQLQGMQQKSLTARIQELLLWTGLQPFAERRAGNLSGGMKRKLEIAVAMLHRPKLLVLDEPTNGVDPVSRQEMWQMITRIGQTGTGVLVSTQYLEEARYCDRVILLEKGHLLLEEAPSKLLSRFPYRVVVVRDAQRFRSRWSTVLFQETGVVDVYTRGADLVVICEGAEQVQTTLARLDGGDTALIEEVSPSFEDVFIHALQMERRD